MSHRLTKPKKPGGKTEMRKRITENLLKRNVTSDVEPDIIWTTYALDSLICGKHNVPAPKSQNCRDNPYCLGRLGLEKFEKLIRTSENEKDGKLQSGKKREVEKMPCGLVNWGNYCYVNSFLQIWFNDPIFRQIIFDWRQSKDYKTPVPPAMDVQAVMDSLQRVFFALQTTPFEDADATAFCKALRLGAEQQDAQEFTLMFFDALDRNLPKHPNGSPINQRIQQRFCGDIIQVLRCTCGHASEKTTKFTSLNLSIAGHATLSSAINAYMEEEDLADYRCSMCDKAGGVKRETRIDSLPPVLLVSLNRYVYDAATGRRKKIKTPVQYPRELDVHSLFRTPKMPKYELGAVMVHEGDNADCGHYWDIIRHPETSTWFSYNDEKVKETKAPGVEVEKKEANTKAIDFKFCYGLIYRRAEKGSPIRLPPPEMSDEWRREQDRKFYRMTDAECATSEMCLNEVQERFKAVSDTINSMEASYTSWKRSVRPERTKIANAKSIAFFPTQALSDLILREFERASRLHDEMQSIASDMDTTTMEDDEETASPQRRIRVRRKVRSIYDKKVEQVEVANALKPVSISLCPHGRIPITTVLSGEMKAVNKTAAETLLAKYGLRVTVTRPDGVSSLDRLRTAAELCDACVLDFAREAQFTKQLEDDAALAQRIFKEVNTRCSIKAFFAQRKTPPEDGLYVAKSSLQSFKKDAQMERDRARRKTQLSLSTLTIGSVEAGPTVTSKRRKRASEVVQDATVSSPTKQSRNGYIAEADMEDVVGTLKSVINRVEEEMNINGEDAMDCEENGRMEEASPANGPTTSSSSAFDVDDDDSEGPFVFNSRLRCEHGGTNVSEFRHLVTVEEWERLTNKYFERAFDLPARAPLCKHCESFEANASADKTKVDELKKAIADSVGEVLKAVEKRRTSAMEGASGQQGNPGGAEEEAELTHGICSRFVLAVKSISNRSRTNKPVPPLCQQCLLCEKHGRPRYALTPVDSTGLHIVPLSREEWVRLISVWDQVDRPDGVGPPTAIRLDSTSGTVIDQCAECLDALLEDERSKRYEFENGYVFVKMQNDEPTKHEGEAGEGGGTSNGSNGGAMKRTNGTRATTRRALAKGMHKVKISSSKTVKDLKIALIPLVHCSPVDQLLYSWLGGPLLDDERTLSESRVVAGNEDRPLVLVVQSINGDGKSCASTEPRTVERGFIDTALAH